jgi:predicted butyrate kinase (DUF1464 family)
MMGLSTILNQIVKQNAETNEQVKLNTQLLQEIVKRQRNQNKNRATSLPSACRLPLHSIEEMDNIEQQLKSKEFYDQLVRKCFCIVLESFELSYLPV